MPPLSIACESERLLPLGTAVSLTASFRPCSTWPRSLHRFGGPSFVVGVTKTLLRGAVVVGVVELGSSLLTVSSFPRRFVIEYFFLLPSRLVSLSALDVVVARCADDQSSPSPTTDGDESQWPFEDLVVVVVVGSLTHTTNNTHSNPPCWPAHAHPARTPPSCARHEKTGSWKSRSRVRSGFPSKKKTPPGMSRAGRESVRRDAWNHSRSRV